MFNRSGIIFCGAAALVLASMPIHATTMTYTDVTSWTSAVTGPTNIDFVAAAMGGLKSYSTISGGLFHTTSDGVPAGVQFLGYDALNMGSQVTAILASQQTYYNFGGGAILIGPQTSSVSPYIHVLLPPNVTAIAANLATGNPNGLAYKATLADGEVFTGGTGAFPTTTFFGVTTDNPISYLDFALNSANASQTYVVIKNFEFGTASTTPAPPPPPDTPEAATLIMIGTGLMAFRGLRKYKNLLGIQQA